MSAKKLTVEERLDAIEAENKQLRERNAQLERQQNVAKFDDGAEVIAIATTVDDRNKPMGLRPGLASFYAASIDHWKQHPHNEHWARRNGYRKAAPADFEETKGLRPDELFEMAQGAYGDCVLYVCPKEHQERRQRDAEARSAIASNAPLPRFNGPDGDATYAER